MYPNSGEELGELLSLDGGPLLKNSQGSLTGSPDHRFRFGMNRVFLLAKECFTCRCKICVDQHRRGRGSGVGHLSFRARYLNRSATMIAPEELIYWIMDLLEGFASLISVGMEA